MPSTVPDKFSLLYQKLTLAATLVQAFRQLFRSLTWAGPQFYASDEYTAFTFDL